jgi:hypothetical protein
MVESRTTPGDLQRYYDRRATDYQKIYDTPERQH